MGLLPRSRRQLRRKACRISGRFAHDVPLVDAFCSTTLITDTWETQNRCVGGASQQLLHKHDDSQSAHHDMHVLRSQTSVRQLASGSEKTWEV